MKRLGSFDELVALSHQAHEDAQTRAVRAAGISIVVRYLLLGRNIVESEQNGADRAAYGKRLLVSLWESLKALGLKVVGATNLKLARQFHAVFGQIGQKPYDQSTLAASPQNSSLDTAQQLSHCFVKLTLPADANVFASRYQLYLPSNEELKAQLESITSELMEGGE